MELAVTGYANRLSARPGETIDVFVSTTEPTFSARVVKMHRRPEAFEHIPSPIDGVYAGNLQRLNPGSFGLLAVPPARWPGDIVVRFVMSPTRIDQDRAGIMTFGPDKGLFVEGDQLVLRAGQAEARGNFPLAVGVWHHITMTFDRPNSRIRLALSAVGQKISVTEGEAILEESIDPALFRVAAVTGPSGEQDSFDGKISSIAVSSISESLIATWDFSDDFAAFVLPDTSGNGHSLRLAQSPRRAVTGPAWNGNFHDPRFAPSHYDAIAFHSDDLSDAGWERSLRLSIPEDWPSGAYAIEVTAAESSDHIPFFVRRAAHAPAAAVAFLVPTFSYLAYANERHWWALPDIKARTGKDLREAVSKAELWSEENQLLSCYDRHRDLSGCTHSSYLRPIVNMRAGYHHPYIGGPHQLSADLEILDWLEAQGIEVDLLTDHDLHAEGLSALSGHAALLTGSHPEYASGKVLDALTAFNRQGGHLAYLGGNGFYCVVNVYPDAPHVMELRRGHASGLHWKSPPGEAHHAATGEPGGYWRLRGRSAHRLFGVGTASVMFDRGQPFVRTEESHRPEAAWIFDGIEGEAIDTESLILGQPAGFEVDQMSRESGTPAHAIRLASAYFQPPVTAYQLGEAQFSGVLPENRADLVYIPGGRSGDIFGAGSIAWTGCLWTDGGNNKVARIMTNLLTHFTAPRADIRA